MQRFIQSFTTACYVHITQYHYDYMGYAPHRQQPRQMLHNISQHIADPVTLTVVRLCSGSGRNISRYVSGLISFASTVIFLFTLDISGKTGSV